MSNTIRNTLRSMYLPMMKLIANILLPILGFYQEAIATARLFLTHITANQLSTHQLVVHASSTTQDLKINNYAGTRHTHHFIRSLIFKSEGVSDAISCFSGSQQTLMTIITLGQQTCGHVDIVHGGLISALFDELLGELFYRVARSNNQKYRGLTAYLKVDFRKPMGNKHPVVFCCKVVETHGRKFHLKAFAFAADPEVDYRTMFNANGNLFESMHAVKPSSEAEALFLIVKEDWEGMLERDLRKLPKTA